MRFIYKIVMVGVLLAAYDARVACASTDRVSFGKDIVISDGDSASSVVCIACSINLQGDVNGDIVSILGSVRSEGPRRVAGGVVTVGGDVSLGDNASVQGDLVVIGGDVNLASGASVQGDRVVFPGRGWLFLPFAPLLIFAGLVWLAIWLVRRRRYRFPMYPYGRGL